MRVIPFPNRGASRVNYNDRRFVSVANTKNGDVTTATVFHYHQEGTLVWATYEGGSVIFGMIVATVGNDDCLDMRYSHLNSDGHLMTGICHSTPEQLADGRLRLRESWQWTSGDHSSGESVIEEIFD